MVTQPSLSIQNNFIAGLKTEFTGLNFPQNAATATSNVIYTLTGDVLRRGGFNYETNFTIDAVNRTGKAISTYKWNNVGGDGSTQLIVRQVGNILYFFLSSGTTTSSPLSAQKLTSTVDISAFKATGSSVDSSITECTYADGNGYLFVYHKDLDPFYCYFTPGSLTTAQVVPNRITVQIRDFLGIYPEPGNPSVTSRPAALNAEHNYNLQNQGWTAQQLWSVNSNTQNYTVSGNTLVFNTGSYNFTVPAGITSISASQPVTLTVAGSLNYQNGGVTYTTGYNSASVNISGIVTSYVGTTLTINVTSSGPSGIIFTVPGDNITFIFNTTWTIQESATQNTINTFQSAAGLFPSNSDVWYTFKNTTGVFDPLHTLSNIGLSSTKAANGHFILNAFTQQRSSASGVAGITDVSTIIRPTNGCWFAGRVWFTGVNASQTAAGDMSYYTWTENIYFTQIVENPSQFGYCYQENDPTDENFFDLLPTDGGVLVIQGSGTVYKLFPVQNGLLVFAANGVWFITGSQGIGFQANDYTLTKVPGSPLITSGTSFVNVQGWPVFWNEEGIYVCSMGQNGSIQIENACVGTILSFYADIPLQSKKFARGDYHHTDYIIEWCFRSTNESSVTDRYQFDTILALNTVNKAFYVYNLPSGTPYIHSVNYVAGPGGSTSPSPTFKYLTSASNGVGSFNFTWSEENDFTRFVDWFSFNSAGTNFVSTFTTAYKLEGKAIGQWQPTYTYVFLRNSVNNSYKIQGLWEFATSGNSGKWSTVQIISDTTNTTNFGMVFHRHKVRGRGLVLQLKFTSVDGKPFDIMGWSIWETLNVSP